MRLVRSQRSLPLPVGHSVSVPDSESQATARRCLLLHVFLFAYVTCIGVSTGRISPAQDNATAMPDSPRAVVQNYCIDCHNADSPEANIDLDISAIDWSAKQNTDLWEKVLSNSSRGIMPPHDADQPTTEERIVLADWVDRELSKHIRIGGTAPRRLNRAEYLKTIRQLVYMDDYELPPGFPGDSEVYGFDNIGAGLVMSPAHVAAYSKVATEMVAWAASLPSWRTI